MNSVDIQFTYDEIRIILCRKFLSNFLSKMIYTILYFSAFFVLGNEYIVQFVRVY